MAKVTAKDVSLGAQELIKQLNTSREQLRGLMGSLRARNDELLRAKRAEQEEQNRRELKDRFDAAVNAINAAKNAPSEEPAAEPEPEVRPARPEPIRPQPAAKPQDVPAERFQRPAEGQVRPPRPA
ncbi:MAG: hypothetical protein IK056_10590, partial [Clostridia bacterium]|nr:hypothetical protein [Clostridia bacterium]